MENIILSSQGRQEELRNLIIEVQTKLLQKIRNGILLTYNDICILGKIGSEHQYGSIFLLKTGSNSKYESTPSLSFIANGKILQPVQLSISIEIQIKSAFGSYYEECQEKVIFKSQHYTIIGIKDNKLDEETVKLSGNILDIFYENSIIKLNIDRDRLLDLQSKIVKKITKGSNYKSIPKLILEYASLDSVVVRVKNDLLSIDKDAGTNEMYKDILYELNKNQEISRSKSLENEKYNILFPESFRKHLIINYKKSKRGNIADFSSDMNASWIAILNSIHFVKPQYFESDGNDNKIKQYMVFPLISRVLFSTSKPIPPRFVLIVQSTRGFTKAELDSVQLIIDAHIQEKTLSQRLESLVSVRRKLQDLIELKHFPDQISSSYFLSIFHEYCDFVANKIIETTMAHSVTVRLFQSGKRSLCLFYATKDNEGEGNYDKSYVADEINVAKRRFSSLNAFVFSQELDYSYIPYISHTDPNKNEISKDLRKLGLQSIINARKNTKSELCLCLKYRTIPVGTINIESSIARAFDEQIDYLQALRDNIQEGFERTLGYNDIQSLSTQIINHAAVHELDQYLNLDLFNKHQKKLLSDLFRLRTVSTNYSSDIDIKKWLTDWVKQTYRQLDKSTQEEIINIVQIKSICRERITPDMWSGLQFILKNLIQNIVGYGSIDKNDGVCILIDDRPLFGIGKTRALRVVCKQSPIRDQATLEKVGISPIISKDNQARFGMLLIFMIAKTLGGYVFIDRSILSSTLEIVIIMPYKNGIA
jgi:hypothetical protein